MGNNFSVSYSNNDISLFELLKEKLPREISLSAFCMEWIKKGIKELGSPGSTLDSFRVQSAAVLPSVDAENRQWRDIVKNVPNTDLKNVVNNLNQKINIVNRELQKRI